MYYALTHLTRFTYDEPITSTVMEVRMQPRSDRNQRCLRFEINISPTTQPQGRKDYLGNAIHVFDIPGQHKYLAIKTESTVEVQPLPPLPDALTADDWDALDAAVVNDFALYDMLIKSHFAQPTEKLRAFGAEINASRRADPLTVVREINSAIYQSFDYIQNITRVDSPIDDALDKRLGVCQDFAHVMIALLRDLRIPCRYVSGYLYHIRDADRSDPDASHAWVEAWLPGMGWVGFDPTNNIVCNEQHIRVAVGRDYADVPPTKGVFIGEAESELEVEVKVTELDELPPLDVIHAPEIKLPHYELMPQQQQPEQQQQQQQ
jgi:transglutaminase-like putative cysteine protease